LPFLTGSHKKRDNRCHIAAPKLEHGLSVALEREGWEVHTQLSEHDLSPPPPLEAATGADPEAGYVTRLKQAAESKRALVLKVSHIGGHKFAGNVIVRLFPVSPFPALSFFFVGLSTLPGFVY
jgi:hypothetical protein